MKTTRRALVKDENRLRAGDATGPPRTAARAGRSPSAAARRGRRTRARIPATRSLTVLVVSTSPESASAPTRAARWTATPPTSSPISSTSPQCSPTRTSKPERAGRVGDRPAAADRASRAGERRQEPVAERLHLAPAEPRQLAADRGVVRRQQLPPARVAELRESLRRADDVGEHHGREHAVGLGSRAVPGQELLDLAEHRLGVPGPRQVIDPRKLDVPGARDPRGELAAGAPVDHAVPASVQDQGRDVDRRQDRPHVDVEEHLEDLAGPSPGSRPSAPSGPRARPSPDPRPGSGRRARASPGRHGPSTER